MSDDIAVKINRPTKAAERQKRPLIIKVGKKLRRYFNNISNSQSLISTEPVLDPAIFEWGPKISKHWPEISKEAGQILRHRDAVPPLKDISPDHAKIAGDGKWRSFFLVGYGFEVAENCARAPITAELVRQIPDLNSAFFSILDAGAKNRATAALPGA